MIKVWTLSVLLSACYQCRGQGVPQNQSDPSVFKIDSSFVSVPIALDFQSVTGSQAIAANQFQLWDNGAAQKPVLLKTEDLPISLVILMQTGDMAAKYFKDYVELPMLLTQVLGTSTHEVTLVTFDSKIEQIWHFPARTDGVKNALRYPSHGDSGAAIRDALHFGVGQLQSEPGRFRRIVVLLSENSDKGSTFTSQELLEQLGTASTIVYSVVFPSARSRPAHRGNGQRSAPLNASPDTLPEVIRALDTDTAAQVGSMTGGNFIEFNDLQSFRSAMLEVGSQIHEGYALGFSPNSPVPGLHNIHVEVKFAHAQSQVRARSLYWINLDTEKSRPPE